MGTHIIFVALVAHTLEQHIMPAIAEQLCKAPLQHTTLFALFQAVSLSVIPLLLQ